MWSQAGRLVGVLAAVTVFAIWLFFIRYNPFKDMSATPAAFGPALFMIALALLAMFAALRTKPLLMLVVFLLSLVPLGMSVTAIPAAFRWFGLLNGLFLLASLLMFKGRTERRR